MGSPGLSDIETGIEWNSFSASPPTPFSFARAAEKNNLFVFPLHHLFHIYSILSSSILPPPLILLRTPLAFVLPSQVLRFWRVLATNLACHLAQLQRIGHKSRLKVVLRRSCRQSSGSSSEPSNGSKYRSGQEVLEEKTCTVKSIIALQSLHLVSEGRSSWQRDHPWNWWHMALDGLRAYRVDR